MRHIIALISIMTFCAFKCVAQKNMDPQFQTNTFIGRIVDSTVVQKIFNARILFIGESHYAIGNEKLKLELFTNYLSVVKKALLVEELPLSYVYFIQRYIETGQDAILRESLTKSGYTFKNQYGEFRELYLTLPDSNKFKIVGLSTESVAWVPIFALFDILSPYQENESLQNDYKVIEDLCLSLELPSSQELLTIAKLLHSKVESNEKAYTIAGFNLFYYERILKGLIIGIEHPVNDFSSENFEPRETFMHETMQKIMATHTSFNIYCQIGRLHVNKKDESWLGLDNWNSLANLLNTENTVPASKNVISLMVYYTNTRALDKKAKNRDFLNSKQRKFVEGKQTTNGYKIIDVCKNNSVLQDYCGVIDGVIINDLKE